MAKREACMRVPMYDATGNHAATWRVWREPRVFNVGGNLDAPYTGPMWMVDRGPDSTTVGIGRNWAEAAMAIRHSADCHGYTCNVN